MTSMHFVVQATRQQSETVRGAAFMIPLAAVSGLVCVRATFAVVNVAPKLSSILVLVDFQLPALALVYQQHLRFKILHQNCLLSSFLLIINQHPLSCTIHLPTEIRLREAFKKKIDFFQEIVLNSGPHPPTPTVQDSDSGNFMKFHEKIICLEWSNIPYKHGIYFH